MKMEKKSGIKKLLEKKGKRFFYLGPKMENGKLIFWLNPMEQKKYKLGWYTLEHLQQWADDKGPVIN